MKYYIIALILLLVGCAHEPIPQPAPMKKQDDLILTTRGHNEEVKKDPN